MNLFNTLLIPLIFFLYFVLFRKSIEKKHLYVLFASVITYVVFLCFDFPFSWTSQKALDPFWVDHFASSLLLETLYPVILSILFYWLFRGSFFKKNPDISFTAIFLYFGFFFYFISLTKTLYVRYDSNLFNAVGAPIFRLALVVVASMVFYLAEKFKPMWASVLILLIYPLYSFIFSTAVASAYMNQVGYVFLELACALLVPFVLFVAAMPLFIGKNVVQVVRGWVAICQSHKKVKA